MEGPALFVVDDLDAPSIRQRHSFRPPPSSGRTGIRRELSGSLAGLGRKLRGISFRVRNFSCPKKFRNPPIPADALSGKTKSPRPRALRFSLPYLKKPAAGSSCGANRLRLKRGNTSSRATGAHKESSEL